MVVSPSFQFECPVKMHYGARALEHLPFELRALDVAKPLVIGDGQASRDGRLAAVLNAFRNAEMTLGVVDAIPDGDPQAIVSQLAAIYRDKDCQAVVAVGQGSAIDMAKWLNLVVSTGEEALEPFLREAVVPRVPKPLVVIPSAAADGFELSGHLRTATTALQAVHLMPPLVFIDPRTTGSANDAALAQTALGALTHALERLSQETIDPMTAVYAQTAARLAVTVLHQLAHHGARDAGLALTATHAAALSGCALGAAALGLTHHLGQAIAPGNRERARQATGILLSYVMEYHAIGARLDGADLLKVMGGRDRYARTPPGQRGSSAIYFLRNLLNLLFQRTEGQVKRTLQDMGLSRDELPEAAQRAVADGAAGDGADLVEILNHAWDGRPFYELR